MAARARRPQLRLVTAAPAAPVERVQPHDPTRRGYVVVWREGEANVCPGCGRSQWHVGRIMVECAFCPTALPIAPAVGGSHHHSYIQPAREERASLGAMITHFLFPWRDPPSAPNSPAAPAVSPPVANGAAGALSSKGPR